jgi:tetratricopeptide (TPR) repeat protein
MPMDPTASDPYRTGLQLAAQGRFAPAIDMFERALKMRPGDTRVLFALANAAKALGLYDVAESFCVKVLAREPMRMEAVVTLANLKRSRGKYGESEALLVGALAADPSIPELWLTYGSLARETGDDGAAEARWRKALALRPGYIPALGNLADILADRGNTAEALRLYKRVLATKPNDAQARLNRAVIHLLTGNLEKGWRDYAARLRLAEKAPRPDHGLKPWNGVFAAAKRLLITAEQGIGDQIMFASVLPDLEARAKDGNAELIVECEARLAALFARSFPSALVHSSTMETRAGVVRSHYAWLKDEGGAEAYVEIGTLPSFLRRTLADFPAPNAYLRTDPVEAACWRSEFSALPRPLIGLCWRSGKLGGHRTLQYAPLEAWADFLHALPGTPVSAQYAAEDGEIARLEALSGRKIVVPKKLDQKNEIDRTAAMLSALDAAVSAPTAVSWLAAGIGVATLKILHNPVWTGFGCNFEPFAPAAICISPRTPGDWQSAFAAAKDAVLTRFSQGPAVSR